MKNLFKRVISVILATALLLGTMPAVFAEEKQYTDFGQQLEELINSADAAQKEKALSFLGLSSVEQMATGETLTSGMFEYTVDENNKVTITGLVYENLTPEIAIPDTIDGKPVVAVKGLSTVASVLQTATDFPSVTSIHIGKNVKSFEYFSNFVLEEITVDENNAYMYASDDILYDKATSKIIQIPLGKEFDRFEIDMEVHSEEEIDEFLELLYLGITVDKLVFTEKFTDSFWSFFMEMIAEEASDYTEEDWALVHEEIGMYFSYMLAAVSAKEFVVPETCEFLYADEFGVLYSKDKSVLIKYPIGNTDIDIYEIDENVDLASLHQGADTLMWSMFSPFVATNMDYAMSYAMYILFARASAWENAGVYGMSLESMDNESLQKLAYQFERLGKDSEEWFIKIAPANLTVHVPDCVMETLPADMMFPSEELGIDRMTLNLLSGANICVANDVTFSESFPGTLAEPLTVSDYNAIVAEELDVYRNWDWTTDVDTAGLQNNTVASEEAIRAYYTAYFNLVQSATRIRPLSEFEICGGGHVIEKPDTPDTPDTPENPEIDETVMPTPTETTINYGDSIVLHVDPAKIPEGGRVEWSSSNNNFEVTVSDDGLTCTITPDRSGDTTFTATIYDADGNVVSADEQEMTSKAGLWQRLIGFFKGLFGLTKVIPQAFRF